jgi:hypothetical protein
MIASSGRRERQVREAAGHQLKKGVMPVGKRKAVKHLMENIRPAGDGRAKCCNLIGHRYDIGLVVVMALNHGV